MNMDNLGEDNDEEDAILPTAEASQLGNSIGGETQHSPSACKVNLHKICRRMATRLSISWPAAQDEKGEERDVVPVCLKEMSITGTNPCVRVPR